MKMCAAHDKKKKKKKKRKRVDRLGNLTKN
jgi:hypothetical protein